jgi:hypothetical protein
VIVPAIEAENLTPTVRVVLVAYCDAGLAAIDCEDVNQFEAIVAEIFLTTPPLEVAVQFPHPEAIVPEIFAATTALIVG